MKLVDCASIINETLSPVMIFVYAMSFAHFSVYAYSLFIFPPEFWTKFKGFAIGNSFLNVHHTLSLLMTIWVCEATEKEQRDVLKEVFEVSVDLKDKVLSREVRRKR